MTTDLARLREHAFELADELDASLELHDAPSGFYGDHGMATVPERRAQVWAAWGTRAYWIALHELGHIAYGHTGMGSQNIVHDEAEAWQWALDQSLIPISDPDRDWCGGHAFSSYLRDFGYLPTTPTVNAVCNQFGIAAKRDLTADVWERLFPSKQAESRQEGSNMTTNQPITSAVYGTKRGGKKKPVRKPERKPSAERLVGRLLGEEQVAALYRSLGMKPPAARRKRRG